MNIVFRIISSTLFLLSAVALAGEETPVPDKLNITATRAETLSAKVDAIDHETREVTLTGSDGETVTFTAGPDVRNLDQVAAGDHVVAEYHENITVAVRNAMGEQPDKSQFQALSRAAKGEKPEALAESSTVLTAIVEDIDLGNNTFKLRWPEGEVEEFTAENPENLKKAEVGDLVVITVEQALGIVVKQPAE